MMKGTGGKEEETLKTDWRLVSFNKTKGVIGLGGMEDGASKKLGELRSRTGKRGYKDKKYENEPCSHGL